MISINKHIQGGMAVIEGTRITVSEIIASLADGNTINQILKDIKSSGYKIKKSDIISAIRYTSQQLAR